MDTRFEDMAGDIADDVHKLTDDDCIEKYKGKWGILWFLEDGTSALSSRVNWCDSEGECLKQIKNLSDSADEANRMGKFESITVQDTGKEFLSPFNNNGLSVVKKAQAFLPLCTHASPIPVK